MAGKADHAAQSEAIGRVIAFAPYAAELKKHLAEILQSPMFRASPRSQHLLEYVVEKALDGEFDLLKERLIGTELFGRPTGYDTGEDAIVRVAASDVRKRLLQFYGAGPAHGRLRIDLPPGSYIPAFAVLEGVSLELTKQSQAPKVENVPPESIEHRPTVGRTGFRPLLVLGLLLVAGTALAFSLVYHPSTLGPPPPNLLPWSALFPKTGPQTNIILSDTNISALQFLLGFRLSLADYANRRYLPDSGHPLSPDMQRVARGFTGMDYTSATAAIDAVTVLRIAQIAGVGDTRIKARPARSMELRDFESDDNFILLGSLSSNPWGALFAEQLDFAFDYDTTLKTEFLKNKHPRTGELARYVPTALGGATGRTYGNVAFFRNPNHAGHILLLAGTTAEATEACVELVCNPVALSAVLRRYNISDRGPANHFEILLGVEEMAGAPAKSDIVAVHMLSDQAAAAH